MPETESERIERKILETQRAAEVRERPAALPAAQPSAPAPVDPVVKEIENILSEDLGPIYRAMTPAQQRVFKVEGERTATAIRRLLEQLKVRAKTILDLIRRWLRVIPGVNKFFMEQEAKIKTDKVMALHDQLHRQ
ncbi:MAG: hypothetical protein HY567_03975 [Candidatus Kerfeldbacteria bacterium]|nr:hypothetical protein [Candidatus Kerfeldbacteria bacterium]